MFDPKLPRSRVYIPAIISGLFLYASFFPLNLGFLAWIALVPLMSLVRANARSRRIYFATFIGGLFCYVPAIQWIRVAHPAMYGSWVFLSICCAIFLVMTLAIIRKLDRTGLPLWLSAPIGFIAMEYFRSHFPTGYTWMEFFNARHPIGFGWYMVGHSQHDFAPLAQIADLTGVYGVTFLVVLVNAAIWLVVGKNALVRVWLRQIREPNWSSRRSSLIAATLLVAAVAYGLVRLSNEPFAEGPRVAMLQTNLPQDIKIQKGQQMWTEPRDLADIATHPKAGEPLPDLVIWPETALPYAWYDYGQGVAVTDVETQFGRDYNMAREDLIELAHRWPVTTLYGVPSFQWDRNGQGWRYNSALLVDARGTRIARYDKIHLVPLGEYVPFPETFPFLKSFTPNDEEYSCKPGESWTRFPLQAGDKLYHFGCLICYEDTDASLARQYVRPSQPGVDFFVNISNDGWFHGTEEHEQHLAICRFRAIETRRSVVRAVNMGISAIIDPNGSVVALPEETWAKSKNIDPVVLRGTVPIDTRTTLYARFGDWLPVTGWFVFFGAIILGFFRKRPAAA